MSLIKLHSIKFCSDEKADKFVKSIFINPESIRIVHPITENDGEAIIKDREKISRMSDISETNLKGSFVYVKECGYQKVAESAEYIASLINK